MDFLRLTDKTILVTGVANRRSIAYFCAKTLLDVGAKVIISAQTERHQRIVKKLFPDCQVYVCDVEKQEEVKALGEQITRDHPTLHGFVHSLAFANYSEGAKPFHETILDDYLQASNISCFSLVALSNALKDVLDENASVVSMSIASTKLANHSYGYMAPIKAALETSTVFLAKSFSEFSNVRFNTVCAGLLKTTASAGIPGYIKPYLFGEKATLRKRALETQEVADLVVYLLSERSSGINASGVVIDAGMNVNYFDDEIVEKVTSVD